MKFNLVHSFPLVLRLIIYTSRLVINLEYIVLTSYDLYVVDLPMQSFLSDFYLLDT